MTDCFWVVFVQTFVRTCLSVTEKAGGYTVGDAFHHFCPLVLRLGLLAAGTRYHHSVFPLSSNQ